MNAVRNDMIGNIQVQYKYLIVIIVSRNNNYECRLQKLENTYSQSIQEYKFLNDMIKKEKNKSSSAPAIISLLWFTR